MVTYGSRKEIFKKNVATPKSVISHMVKMYPPTGALYHVGEDGAVVLSQEELLLQDAYVYAHPNSPLALQVATLNSMKSAVLRVSIISKGSSEVVGSAVVVNESGLCLTAFHCVCDSLTSRRAKKLKIGSYSVKVRASSESLGLVVLEITDPGTYPFIRMTNRVITQGMDIALLSYPQVADTDFSRETLVEATITSGIVSNVWSPILVGGDYTCFPGSSGGAVIHQDTLLGLHLEMMYAEAKESLEMDETGSPLMKRIKYLESNVANKSFLGIFLSIQSIVTFLYDHNLIPPMFPNAVSSASSSRVRSYLVRGRN